MSTETSQFKKQKYVGANLILYVYIICDLLNHNNRYYKQSEKSSLLDSTARVLLQDVSYAE